jgi:elongation factor Ts
MSKVSMDLVKELREKTQVGMMDCKKALEESNGDFEKAVEILRKKGAAVAAKRADNATDNGRIEAFISSDFRKGSLVEVCCETDFSANTQAMHDFVVNAAKLATENGISDKEVLMATCPAVKDQLDELIAKITEKIEIKQISNFVVTGNGVVNAYIHPGSTVGIIIQLETEKDASGHLDTLKQLARDLCMQIAVNKPLGVVPADIDQTMSDKELALIKDQLKDDKRPEAIIAKITEGRMNKFYEDVCLTYQKFIKNDKLTISQHLAELSKTISNPISIKRFSRFSIGR